jgi:arabinose-5-phosphate isomerase
MPILRVSDFELLNVAKNVLRIERDALESTENSLGADFLQAVNLILNGSASGRVVVMGMGKSGHIGNKIAATLASTGTPAFFVHPAEAGHGDLGMITASDIVLAISQSGKSDELLRVIPYFKRNGIQLIAMTGNLQSPLALHATAVINTTVAQEACPLGLAPTTSTTLTLALGDALAACLLKSKGFTIEKFASTHPHGTLGRKLLVTISDIMVKNDAVPVVPLGTSIRTTIGEMSRAALGFVNVADDKNHLLGIFTDGDLRRTLDREIDIKMTPIDGVMAKKFVVAHPQQLAVEAVDLMGQHKISSIPIVDEDNMLVGAINMRILLQAGVV